MAMDFMKLQQSSYTIRNYKTISNVVLISTYTIVTAVLILVVISLNLNYARAFDRLLVCGLAVLYITVTQLLVRFKYEQALAHVSIAFYIFLASTIIWNWGINAPLGILVFGLVIVLAGILLTARATLYVALIDAALVLGAQTAVAFGWHQPNTFGMNNTTSNGDVITYCIVFGMIALVTWQYNLETERSLAHAKRAEAALLQQKATLEQQVKKRTAELRQSQLEEMQQMYRFAELGQLGVTLLHDIANYLSALTLEIEDLERTQHSTTIARIGRIIHYLDDVIVSTRTRLHGGTQKQSFDLVQKTSQTISILQDKATKAGVTIDWRPPPSPWKHSGDPENFSQLITIIANNAIDAYIAKAADLNERTVTITMQRDEAAITIRILDAGKGIPPSKQQDLFKPSRSKKRSGLGIGLYIAKQIVEMQFSGTITLNSRANLTEFIITLPRT